MNDETKVNGTSDYKSYRILYSVHICVQHLVWTMILHSLDFETVDIKKQTLSTENKKYFLQKMKMFESENIDISIPFLYNLLGSTQLGLGRSISRWCTITSTPVMLSFIRPVEIQFFTNKIHWR